MLTKQQVISAIKLMPDTFDTTQLFDRIVLLNKIEEGRKQIKEGKTYTTGGQKEIKEMAQVVWSTQSLKDIDEIANYIAKDYSIC